MESIPVVITPNPNAPYRMDIRKEIHCVEHGFYCSVECIHPFMEESYSLYFHSDGYWRFLCDENAWFGTKEELIDCLQKYHYNIADFTDLSILEEKGKDW